MPNLAFLLFLTFSPSALPAAEPIAATNPIEAGDVAWRRDFDAALAESEATGKPLLVLFQEIPGCIGCRTFGSEVLTEPLLVEAIESLFLPVLVYNNRPGTEDAGLLRRYHEPAWNYQVIRFLDAEGNDLLPRRDRIWTIAGVAARMIAALEAASRPVPLYLRALQLENEKDRQAVAAFAMACFWTGEFKLGGIEGVVATEAGWYDNREVTLVTYHRDLITLQELVEIAARERCAQRVYLPAGTSVDPHHFDMKRFDRAAYRRADPSDQKKQLDAWPELKGIETLSDMQATKLNALLPLGRDEALHWLSPRQLGRFGKLEGVASLPLAP